MNSLLIDQDKFYALSDCPRMDFRSIFFLPAMQCMYPGLRRLGDWSTDVRWRLIAPAGRSARWTLRG
ncbi:hypothetical protein ACUH78_02690 [Thauera sp. ZXT1-4]|uniref:hypothetical protein n=1 Tax=Thauera sp. ZXT1-4 TaxID=3460294 RepID=UPI0040409D27